MTVQPTEDVPRPYADAVMAYIRAGWAGCLPLPLGKKWPPYNGYTGEKGQWPSGADVQAWLDGPEAAGNIALRLPTNVIGLDVDAYGQKQGGDTIAAAIGRYGDLPRTWRTTSRIDNHSGIYLFRIADETLRWPGQLGTHVEIIQQKHRYAVAPPSLHPEGMPYRWIDPYDNIAISPPRVDDLPYLPDAWVQGITAGQQATDTPRASMDAGTATPWLISRLGDQDASACGVTDYAGKQAIAEHDNGSRHDAIARGTLRLVRLAAEGHIGCFAALNYLRAHFVRSVTTDGSRDERTAHEEWVRALVSACNVVAANPSDGAGTTDPCDLASLIVTVPTASTPESPAQPPSQPQSHQDENWEGLIPPTAEEAPTPSAGAQDPNQDQLLHAQINEADPRFTEALAKEMMRRQVRARVNEQEAARTFRAPASRISLVDELAIVDPPITWSIDKLLPAGGNALLVAQYKAGKTVMLANLVRAYADGAPFLGAFDVPRLGGRVAFWNYEVSEAQWRAWLKGFGIDNLDAASVLHVVGHRLPILTPSVEDWAVDWLLERNVKALIVDPLAKAMVGSGEENDNTDLARFTDALDVIKSRAGVQSLFLSHHMGWEKHDEGEERGRGGSYLPGWADAIWTMTMEKAKDKESDTPKTIAQRRRFFRAEGRDVDLPENGLDFDEATKILTMHGGDRAWVRKRGLEADVLAFITAHPGCGTNEIATNIGGRRAGVLKAIDTLVFTSHEVIRQVDGQAHRHYPG